MKHFKKIAFIFCLSLLSAQANVVPQSYNGFTASFKYDRNVDFFGEGKFLRNSFSNNLSFGYIYNSTIGIDLTYGYSKYDRKDNYEISENNSQEVDESYFNFVDNFRVENKGVGDKGFSFGLTYYLNENQDLFNYDLPVNLSIGFRYGSSNYSSNDLDELNQDFYGKFYSLELGIFKQIDTSADFYLIPRINLNLKNEKNIYDSILVEGETDSFNLSSNYFEFALPFIIEETSAGKIFFEPSFSNIYGSSHIGLRFGFLF